MKSCQFEHLLPPYLQQELSKEDHTRVADHLISCESCQTSLSDLKNVDALLNSYARAAVPQQLYALYTTELKQHFKTDSRWVTGRRNALAALSSLFVSNTPSFRLVRAAALLLIGVFVGRLLFMPSQESIHSQFAEQQQTLSKADVQFIADYVVKSELLLLTIANAATDAPSPDDIYLNKDIAQTLLYKTSQVQRKAAALDDDRVLAFLNHLELVLLEISNRDDDDIRDAFQTIKEMVNDAEMVQTSRRLQRRLEKTLQNT